MKNKLSLSLYIYIYIVKKSKKNIVQQIGTRG